MKKKPSPSKVFKFAKNFHKLYNFDQKKQANTNSKPSLK